LMWSGTAGWVVLASGTGSTGANDNGITIS